MLVTRYSTDHLPPAERFAWWHEMTAATLIPTALETDQRAAFRATAELVDLGPAQVTAMTYQPLTVTRTPRLIRQRDPEYYQLSLTVRGRMTLSQVRHEVAFGTGDLVLYDSSRPFTGSTTVDDGTVAHTVAQVPRRLVPIRPALVDRVLATRMSGDEGFAHLLGQFMVQVANSGRQYGPADSTRLFTTLVDLLAATVAQRVDDRASTPVESRERVLVQRVRSFVERHLGDPDLTPARVAAAHHVSVRTLHRLFQGQGDSVAAHIRQRRLERARRDLADPLLRDEPIRAVAARWGYPRAADFTRAFRTAYGLAPRDFREALSSRARGVESEGTGALG